MPFSLFPRWYFSLCGFIWTAVASCFYSCLCSVHSPHNRKNDFFKMEILLISLPFRVFTTSVTQATLSALVYQLHPPSFSDLSTSSFLCLEGDSPGLYPWFLPLSPQFLVQMSHKVMEQRREEKCNPRINAFRLMLGNDRGPENWQNQERQ